MLTALWTLVIFTGILTAATGFYLYVEKNPEEKAKAVGNWAEDTLRLRSIEEHLSLRKKTDKEKEGENG